MKTPRKFTIAKLSIRKLGSLSVLIIMHHYDEDLSLRIESFAILNLRGVSTKLYFNYIVISITSLLLGDSWIFYEKM